MKTLTIKLDNLKAYARKSPSNKKKLVRLKLVENIPKSIMIMKKKSSLRELTIAVLMTHWDYIAPVFFFR